MSRRTLRDLVTRRIGEDPCEWVRRRKEREPAIGWRPLAEELSERAGLTGGREISHESLRQWCREPPADDPL